MPVPTPVTDEDAAVKAQFLQRVEDCLAQGSLVKLVLGKYVGIEADLQRILMRPVQLKGQPQISLVYRYPTKDITKNATPAAALKLLDQLLGASFKNAHLMTLTGDLQLGISKRGRYSLHTSPASHGTETSARAQTPAEHNRSKQRWVDVERPYLIALGITNEAHQLVPSMARKWKQINKFIEVFERALLATPLAGKPGLRVADFGSGKGYLTFALYDYLRQVRGISPEVRGVDLRADLVRLCNRIARELDFTGLEFTQGDVSVDQVQALDVMIALHACDTATDHAIHKGIRAGARIILCAPCCHKQIRPQLLKPHPLRPMLEHGIHLGQEAEMLTDTLRALLLESQGYDTQVFEFIALEHTSKNKMILAVKRQVARDTAPMLEQIQTLKSFYGIQSHSLETLLQNEPA